MNFFRRTKMRHPAAPDSPYTYTPGPVFTEPAMAAIFHSDLALPAQRVLGAGYPIAMQFRSIQSPSLYAEQAVTLQGIGIQNGQFALPLMTDDDGGFGEDGDSVAQDS